MARRRTRNRQYSSSNSRRRPSLHLHAPPQILWVIALVLFIIGLIGTVLNIGIDVGPELAIWSLVIACALLLLGTATDALR